MKQIKIIAILIFAVSLHGCEKVINIDIKDTAPQIVIEGTIDNSGGAKVVITKTANFNNTSAFPIVSGAMVNIKDAQGNSYNLLETSNGVYTNSSAVGVIGQTYTMTVILNGKTYSAKSTIPRQMFIDTIIQNIFDAGPQNGLVKAVDVIYTDLVGYGDYVHVLQKINNIPEALSFYVDDDRFTDGGTEPFPIVNTRKKLKTGDVLEVEMRCIDKDIFRYLTGLTENASQNTIPANPETNIKGGALGYFSAHTSEKQSITIR